MMMRRRRRRRRWWWSKTTQMQPRPSPTVATSPSLVGSRGHAQSEALAGSALLRTVSAFRLFRPFRFWRGARPATARRRAAACQEESRGRVDARCADHRVGPRRRRLARSGAVVRRPRGFRCPRRRISSKQESREQVRGIILLYNTVLYCTYITERA
jgi:hypothetical protein